MEASGRDLDSREEALERDRADPLAAFRAEFLLDEEGIVYMDGNSLGRPPRAVLGSLERVVRDGWGGRLIRAWTEGWMDVALELGDRIGALLGAAAGQLAVADSTTVCFYKAACAALDARPGRSEILTDPGNFPTDRYVLESLAALRGQTLEDVPVRREVARVGEDLAASGACVERRRGELVEAHGRRVGHH